MMKGLKRIAVGLVAVGLSMALLLTAIPVCEAGPSERVVRIGQLGVFTGPLATLGVPPGEGMIDIVKYINKKGGIKYTNDKGETESVKVDMMWEDTGYLLPKMIMTHKRFVAAGEVVEICVSTTSWEAMRDRYIKEGIPCVGPSPVAAPDLLVKPPWFFLSMPTWNDIFASCVKWIKDNWTESRPIRIGAMAYDVAAGRSFCENAGQVCSILGGMECIGWEVVPCFGLVDTSVEWLRLASKRPDWVVVLGYGANMVVMVKDYARLGIREKGVEFVGTPYSIDELVVNITGKSSEGCYVGRPIPTRDEQELPGVRTMLEIGKKYRGYEPDKVDSNYVAAWLYMQVIFEGIRLALEKVGYDSLDGRAVRDALVSIKDFDTGLVPPIAMSEEKPWICSVVRMYQIRQGKITPVSDWYEFPIVYERILL